MKEYKQKYPKGHPKHKRLGHHRHAKDLNEVFKSIGEGTPKEKGY